MRERSPVHHKSRAYPQSPSDAKVSTGERVFSARRRRTRPLIKMTTRAARFALAPLHFVAAVAVSALGTLLTPIPGKAETPSRGSKVSLNPDLVLEIDGRKVFPIGFTMPPLPDARAPDGRSGLEELHAAGANFLRTGVMGVAWSGAALELEQKYQDPAARLEMHCLVNLRELGSLRAGETAQEAQLRKLVNRFKDHPGMGVWKHVDEPEWGKHPIPPMPNVTRIIRELDPHHPIEITHAPRGTIESLRPYNATTDTGQCK